MSYIKQMIDEAFEIKDYCDSEYSSDREVLYKSEQFKQKYGMTWTEVISEYKEDNLEDF